MERQAVVNVQTFLNGHPFGAFQWQVFALCFVIVLLDGFDTAAIGYIAPSLVREWGVSRPALGPVLSSALFGLAFGALGSGPLADRVGRRLMLIGSVLVFGVACLASSFSTTLEQLTAMRFLTGLGLGAAMPNAVTMMSEYCPDARRATLTNLMFCGFPLGAALGGFLAAWMIPNFGWRSVLLLGGLAPLALAALMLLVLPESVRYMVAKRHDTAKIRAALRRVSPSADDGASFVITEHASHAATTRHGLGLVLSGPFVVGSVMLWIAYFMGLVVFYALINWMPILFKDAGMAPRTATLISALFPLGGIGAVFFGLLMDRFAPDRIIAIGYGLTALAIYAIGQSIGQVGVLVLTVLVAGVLMNTAQSSMPALAAPYYPTQGRATGVAWMLGIGRFGGIAGSFLVAEMTRRQFALDRIFTVVAAAGLIAAAALLVKQWVSPNGRETDVAPGDAAMH